MITKLELQQNKRQKRPMEKKSKKLHHEEHKTKTVNVNLNKYQQYEERRQI